MGYPKDDGQEQRDETHVAAQSHAAQQDDFQRQ